MRFCRQLLVSGAILALASGVLMPLSASAVTWTVNTTNFVFTPSTLTISQGDSVKWVWVSGLHTTTSGSNCVSDGLWDAPVDQQHPTFARVFNTGGAFPYYCTFHCATGMTGLITVNANAGVPSASAMTTDRPALAASPNPFHGLTSVSFNLPQADHLRLAVYNAAGRQVALLANGTFGAGAHSVSWDGKATGGGTLPGGVYFARTTTAQGGARTTLIKLD